MIALAWHVDYWDHLGWRDPFASRLATTRQQAYARQLGSEVFTPALVVNGAKVVIGSDNKAVEAAIEAATALPVSVTLSRSDDGIAAEIGAASAPVRALRIVYDPEHATAVGAGENEGERLREYRIVREVETLGEWDGAARRFDRQAARHRPGPGHPGAVGRSSYDRRGGPAARLIRAVPPCVADQLRQHLPLDDHEPGRQQHRDPDHRAIMSMAAGAGVGFRVQ